MTAPQEIIYIGDGEFVPLANATPQEIERAKELENHTIREAAKKMLAALNIAEEFLSNNPANDPGDGTLGVVREAIAFGRSALAAQQVAPTHEKRA